MSFLDFETGKALKNLIACNQGYAAWKASNSKVHQALNYFRGYWDMQKDKRKGAW